jgi:hypothetical protein
MAGRSKRPELDAADIERLTAGLVEAIRREGSLPISKLAAQGIPKLAKAATLERFARDGLEVGTRLVRVPLSDQLRARLREGAALGMRTLTNAIVGATKKEATLAAMEMVRRGEARLVLRGTEATLMAPTTRVLETAEMTALEGALSSMIKGIKAARKAQAVLLASDVQDLLTRLHPGAHVVAIEDVLEHTRKLGLETGLAFVPDVVRAFGGRPVLDVVHEALRTAARRGLLELRPESGLGRLSEDDLALCVPGPQGSRLSWARTMEAR